MSHLNYLDHDMDALTGLDAPRSLDELIGLLRDTSEGTVWRGQAYFVWPAIPTLYRRLRQSGFIDSQISESLIVAAEERILADAKQQGLIEGNDSVVEFMARLQHYGGATRLLDVTTDWRVALYFACASHPSRTGIVLAYRVNPDNRIKLAGPSADSCDWGKLLSQCEDERLLLVEPAPYDKRIAAQHGAFIMTALGGTLAEPTIFTHQSHDAEVKLTLVNQKVKKEALAYLDARGITGAALFPSIESFARECSANKPIEVV